MKVNPDKVHGKSGDENENEMSLPGGRGKKPLGEAGEIRRQKREIAD